MGIKVIILAGGYGSRFSEETSVIPKPMIEIGNKPILWHIMKYFSYYNFKNFILCLGYKQEKIREYFINYYKYNSNIKVYTNSEIIKNHSSLADLTENWSVDLIDTGLNTLTGGRLLRLKSFIKDEKTFILTYGDGLANVDLNVLIEFHKSHGKIATISTIPSKDKFGVVEVGEENKVISFSEKKLYEKNRTNIGFFVFNKEIFDYLKDGDQTILEKNPLETLANEGELMAYLHDGFFKCMDSLKDKNEFEQMIKDNNTPWMIWE